MSAMLAPQLVPQPMRVTMVDRVIAIEQDIYEFPWTIGNFRDALAADYACWEYWNEIDLVGYAIVMSAPDEVHLLNLSVARALQGRGYGGRMLAHLLGAARGLERMLLEVRPSNEVARKLYEREGFTEIGRRRGYYPALNGREDAIILAKTL